MPFFHFIIDEEQLKITFKGDSREKQVQYVEQSLICVSQENISALSGIRLCFRPWNTKHFKVRLKIQIFIILYMK